MWHDNETNKDLIGFKRFADTISSLAINERILPVTIGLYSDWGGGKSSVLRMIEDNLISKNKVIVLRFDGWLFDGYDDTRAALMTTIINGIEEYVGKNESLLKKVTKRTNALRKKINWLRTIGLATKGILALTSPASAPLLAGLSIAEIADLVKSKAKDPEAITDQLKGILKTQPALAQDKLYKSIDEFRGEFKALLQEARVTNLVVLVDDLDRCLPESIISTLEAIKLFLSVPGTAFVIAADERVVKHAVARRYPPKELDEIDLSQDYLDKMVQVPFVLPPMNEVETETYLYLLFAEQILSEEAFKKLNVQVQKNLKNPELSQPLNYGIAQSCLGDEANQIESEFVLVERIAPIFARNLQGNPRLIKRFLNTFSLRIQLGSSSGISLDKGVLAKLMILERFHQEQFKQLYDWQSAQDGLPEEIKELEEIARATTKSGDSKKKSFQSWLDDPDLRSWLRMEPSLVNKNLLPYYHLARESVTLKMSEGRRLSQEQQELLRKLLSKSQAVVKSAAKTLVQKPDNEIFVIYDTLWGQIREQPGDPYPLNGAYETSLLHEGVAQRFIAGLQSISPGGINIKLVPRLGQISQSHASLKTQVADLLKAWSQSSDKKIANAARVFLKRIGK